jgi:hypothetical protein
LENFRLEKIKGTTTGKSQKGYRQVSQTA